MRGRRKYQAQAAFKAEADWRVNFEVAKFGRLKDSSGARLAVEFRELSYLDDTMCSMEQGEQKQFAKIHELKSRIKKAKSALVERAINSDTRFFEEFAEGTELAKQMFPTTIENGQEIWDMKAAGGNDADPLASMCISKFMALSLLKGSPITFKELLSDIQKHGAFFGISDPEESDLRKLCAKIGLPFSKAKRGRKRL